MRQAFQLGGVAAPPLLGLLEADDGMLAQAVRHQAIQRGLELPTKAASLLVVLVDSLEYVKRQSDQRVFPRHFFLSYMDEVLAHPNANLPGGRVS